MRGMSVSHEKLRGVKYDDGQCIPWESIMFGGVGLDKILQIGRIERFSHVHPLRFRHGGKSLSLQYQMGT
jgi:hypothetical protein